MLTYTHMHKHTDFQYTHIHTHNHRVPLPWWGAALMLLPASLLLLFVLLLPFYQLRIVNICVTLGAILAGTVAYYVLHVSLASVDTFSFACLLLAFGRVQFVRPCLRLEDKNLSTSFVLLHRWHVNASGVRLLRCTLTWMACGVHGCTALLRGECWVCVVVLSCLQLSVLHIA